MTITLTPIGEVTSPYEKPEELFFACEKGLHADTTMQITLKPAYAAGLKGLEQCSHAFIIYHLHEADHEELTARPGPPSIPNLPTVGVYASRSQFRPNHLALRLVRIKAIKGNILEVQGLDAINKSMVVDIKPYVSGFDRPQDYTNAPWYAWLEENNQ